MIINQWKFLIIVFTSLYLLACGGSGGGSNSGSGGGGDNNSGSGGGNNSGGSGGAVTSTISITGIDTAAVGEEFTVSFFMKRSDFNGADDFIGATSSGVTLDFVRAGVGEVSAGDIDQSAYLADIENSVIFNVFELAISMRININGDAWLYSLTCTGAGGMPEPCSSIVIDTQARTVTLNDAVVEPTIGGEANSMATAPLTLNGVITWAEADENPQAPITTPVTGSTGGGSTGGGSAGGGGLSLAEIVGVWDASREINGDNDERYIVISAEGSYVEFDYQGDSVNAGDNCYVIWVDTLSDEGAGNFLLSGIDSLAYTSSGENIIEQGSGSETTFRPTTLSEGDFVPSCVD